MMMNQHPALPKSISTSLTSFLPLNLPLIIFITVSCTKHLPPKTMKLSFLIFFLQASLVLCASNSQPSQLTALLSLKSSLKDPLFTLNGWESKGDSQGPVWCSWSGIKCHPNASLVVSLDLSRRNLSGTIPPEIHYLSGLIHLNLSSNGFSGPLQPSIFHLTQLRILDISHNDFSFTFPTGISKLKFLRVLNAYSNSFTGPLPRECTELRFLEKLNLSGSYFEGSITPEYGSIPKLRELGLAGNVLNGSIPPQLGDLSELTRIEIGYNAFTGDLPVELTLLSNLTYLDISNNLLSGSLPPELGNLTNLNTLFLFKNRFSGEIPATLGNLQSLQLLDLSDNRLSDSIPAGIASLLNLNRLSLMNNFLIGEIPSQIGNLPNLETLLLWNNSLTGTLPRNLGSNSKLVLVDLSSNSLTGPIPDTLCSGNNLVKLILFSNRFSTNIPTTLATCTSLVRLRIQRNELNGSIPVGFGSLPNLTFFDVSENYLAGPIPSDIGNAAKLEYLNISGNPLRSSLPQNIWNATSLQIFSGVSGGLTGEIPRFVIGCKSLYKLELDDNELKGTIPSDIERCEKLISLSLRRNNLTGNIPPEISSLPSITDVDLSHNSLSGEIPVKFDSCRTLETFNVSFNLLAGPVPAAGAVFQHLHPTSFSGNDGLCGVVLDKPCVDDDVINGGREKPKKTAGAIVWVMTAAFGIGLFVLVAATRCFHAWHARGNIEEGPQSATWKMTAFQRLNFTAEDVLESLQMSDKVIGMGGTGTVYKAEMPGGEIIAVKKLWGKQKENMIRRRRGVLAEVEVLGNVRHRNIVRLLGCCVNMDATMLLYEYMPNGNLDDLLHGKNKAQNLGADWVTRYKIALGVAQGISYLHHDCDPVIVHRDLKPSNILLDGDMEARVADFGVAKLIESDVSMSVIAGSYGYIAPEYAYTLQVDEKSDIYSFGVVLLEILSGKRSVEAIFGDGNSIVDWVRTKIKSKDGIDDVLDKNAGAGCTPVREEMMQMLKIALLCTSRNPAERPSMRDVVLMLIEAKPKRKLPHFPASHVVGRDRSVSCGDLPMPQKPTLDC